MCNPNKLDELLKYADCAYFRAILTEIEREYTQYLLADDNRCGNRHDATKVYMLREITDLFADSTGRN